MGLNVELLRKIVAFAEEEPRRLVMETFYEDVGEALSGECELEELNIVEDFGVAKSLDDLAPCGTACCIAGAACILAGTAIRRKTYYSLPAEGWTASASKLLGLETDEQMDRLFLPYDGFSENEEYEDREHWPEPFASAYKAVRDNPAERVKVLKARIEHFIATDGNE